jgi:hypothetical protein
MAQKTYEAARSPLAGGFGESRIRCQMKIQEFKKELQDSLAKLCRDKGWDYHNNKQRGMAFEDWCFKLFSDRYPAADNEPATAILRGDDAQIDIIFDSREVEDIYIIQCKNPKIAAQEPIPENEVLAFFSEYKLFKDRVYLDSRKSTNSRIQELSSEFAYWIKQGYLLHFVFISTGRATDKTDALVEKFSKDNKVDNVKFEVWDLGLLKDEYEAVASIEEQYPDEIIISLRERHYFQLDGEPENITFVIPGTILQELALKHKERLFNWNIRRFLGKKGEVNKGISDTLDKEPNNFYYYNNGISALCEEFLLDQRTKSLKVKKLQVVNGAQTLGAIKNASQSKLQQALVLVKLTSIKHASRERGIAAELIRTNNTQNTLRVPDFRSNDKIQQWLEVKFKNTKPKGNLLQIVYARKRPYPYKTSAQQVIKLQDLGKIRYAWYFDPRIPIADPSKLFQLKEESGLYEYAFGSDGDSTDVWTEDQFRECLLAIHSYNRITFELHKLQDENEDLKQVSRLKYYGLKLFKIYLDQVPPSTQGVGMDELLAFGSKFEMYFETALSLIGETLSQSYRDILMSNEGTAFSLPRDTKVWDKVKTQFERNLSLIRKVRLK